MVRCARNAGQEYMTSWDDLWNYMDGWIASLWKQLLHTLLHSANNEVSVVQNNSRRLALCWLQKILPQLWWKRAPNQSQLKIIFVFLGSIKIIITSGSDGVSDTTQILHCIAEGGRSVRLWHTDTGQSHHLAPSYTRVASDTWLPLWLGSGTRQSHGTWVFPITEEGGVKGSSVAVQYWVEENIV